MPLIPDQIYHVYNHATGDDNFFRSDENYRYFLEKYQKHILPIVDTYAYCLMPNHFHFMVRIKNEHQLKQCESFKLSHCLKIENFLSKQFANLFSAYTQAFNKMYGRHGALFRERFRRKHVDNDSYFTGLIAYIHHNPVHHGFVKNMADWTWSSWHAYTSQKKTKLQVAEVLEWFGNTKNMLDYHADYQQMDKDYNLFEDE